MFSPSSMACIMKALKKHISIILLFLFTATSGQVSDKRSFIPLGSEKIIVMQPTGEMINGLPEMLMLSDTAQLRRKIYDIVENSYMNDMLDVYFLAATYLKNRDKLVAVEPAYLALSEKEGGFAKVGFHLRMEGDLIEKENAPYVDIVSSRVNGKLDRLMSITQLYPHEMGHVIFGLLSGSGDSSGTKSVDMHYFSVRTDYSTAFNEGFAEHIENVSRIFEKNEVLRRGIFADIEKIKLQSEYAINGFEKDFLYPFRIGYFKLSMPLWYQKYENLKRYEQAMDGTAKFLNATLELKDIEDRLTIRNAGIRHRENELRNYVQMLSTEGVICSFFTQLTLSELADHYLDKSFYQPFLLDTLDTSLPKEIFTPVQNQFLKYFHVFHEHMPSDGASGSEFVDFMNGYISAFPAEEEVIKRVFNEVTGLEYTNNLPPELWLLVKNHSHRLLVPDAYGAITTPVYTFDLNAAEAEDLLTLKGLKEEEANRIIKYRKANGFFTDFDQIKEIEGITNASIELLLNSKFDEKYFEELPKPELNFKSLLLTSSKHLILSILAYFTIVLVLIHLFSFRKEYPPVKRMVSIYLIYFIQWIVFVVGGLIFVTISDRPWQLLALMTFFFLVLNWLFHRKARARRDRSFFATCVMGSLVLLSLL